MSWSAHLIDDRGHGEGDWGYTHNTNQMANAALYGDDWSGPLATFDEVFRISDEAKVAGKSWWKVLDGMDGPTGAALLKRITDALAADPDRFRAMNPENGWGNYDEFLGVLREMMSAVPEWHCTWSVHG